MGDIRMMTNSENKQIKFHMITIENLVPENHFLRKLNRLADFSFIREETKAFYCHNNGRPCIDPVVLVKYLLIGFLYGIESERRLEQEIQVNMAYRWFLGLDLDERVPDHSTLSQNRRRRFRSKELYRTLFLQIVRQCMEKGLVDGKLIVTDSTHVKANASRQSEHVVEVEKAACRYLSKLDEYEQVERTRLENAGKLPHKEPVARRETTPKIISKRVSRTDPEAGFYKRKGKPEGMHYLSHQSLDTANGIIVDVYTTPGNVTDATPYVERIDAIHQTLGFAIESAGADSGYDISLVHQQMQERGIRFYTPINHEKPNYKSSFTRSDFTYESETDTFQCPGGKGLPLKRLQRNEYGVYREYRAEKSNCQICPFKNACLTGSFPSRRLQVNIFEAAVKKNHDADGSAGHREALRLRQIWCEGSFAAQKARHNLKRLLRRGLEAAEEHCLLSATALNLKRMVNCLG